LGLRNGSYTIAVIFLLGFLAILSPKSSFDGFQQYLPLSVVVALLATVNVVPSIKKSVSKLLVFLRTITNFPGHHLPSSDVASMGSFIPSQQSSRENMDRYLSSQEDHLTPGLLRHLDHDESYSMNSLPTILRRDIVHDLERGLHGDAGSSISDQSVRPSF
jgi:hypothetical protein